jgi:hypothetical protein
VTGYGYPLVRRSLSIALRALSVILASAAVVLVLIVWRLASGPISLQPLTPYIEQALSAEGAGLRAEVGDTAMTLSAGHGIELVALDVRWKSPDGEVPIALPEIRVDLSLRALLFDGLLAPTRLDAEAPRLILVRDEGGGIGLASLAGERTEHTPTLDVQALLGPLLAEPASHEPLSYVQTVHIIGGEMVLDDRITGTSLRAGAADLTLARDAQSLRGQLDFKLDQPGHVVDVNLSGHYVASAPRIAYELKFGNLEPADIATFVPAVPATGLQFSISGTLRGAVKVEGGVLPVRFQLRSEKGRIELPDQLAQPVTFSDARARGGFDPAEMSLTLDELSLVSHGATLRASGTGAWPDSGLRLRADVEARDLTVAELDRFWPPEAGDAAREWVLENITEGRATRGTAHIEIDPGDLDQDPVPGDLISGSFEYQDLTVGYFKDFPPIAGIDGRATFDARSMQFTSSGGAVGELRLENGIATITGLGFEGRYMTRLEVVADIEGPLDAALTLLEREPLGFPSKLGIEPQNASGHATTKLRMDLPLYREVEDEDLRVAADARLTDVAISGLFGQVDLQNGRFTLDITDEDMDLAGDAVVQRIPLAVDWQENFGDDRQVLRRYHLSGTAGEADLAALGVTGLPEGLEGEVAFSVDGTQTPATQQLKAVLDLARMGITVPWLDWQKRPGEPGNLTLEALVPEEGAIRVDSFTLDAAGLSAQGSLQVGQEPFELRVLALDQFSFREQQLSGFIRRDVGGWHAEIVAKSLDLDPLVAQAGSLGGDDEAPPVEIDLKADRVLLGGRGVQAVVAHAVRNREGWESADLAAMLPGGARIEGTLLPKNGGHLLSLFTSDAGALLEALDQTKRVQGGELTLDATITRQRPDVAAEGTLVADSFTLLDAPVLARLLTLASLRGIGDVLGGRGIAFDELNVPFRLADGVLRLNRGRMSGSQLGLTFEGEINIETERLDLNGTIVPIYTINRIIGEIPVIGDFLTGSEGEGAFAATFTMTGEFAQPEIRVNPLSVLAPGFIRDLISGIREGTTTPPNPHPRDD